MWVLLTRFFFCLAGFAAAEGRRSKEWSCAVSQHSRPTSATHTFPINTAHPRPLHTLQPAPQPRAPCTPCIPAPPAPLQVSSLPAEARALLPPALQAQPQAYVRLGSTCPPAVEEACWRAFHAACEPLYRAGRLGCVLFQFHLSFQPSQANLQVFCGATLQAGWRLGLLRLLPGCLDAGCTWRLGAYQRLACLISRISCRPATRHALVVSAMCAILILLLFPCRSTFCTAGSAWTPGSEWRQSCAAEPGLQVCGQLGFWDALYVAACSVAERDATSTAGAEAFCTCKASCQLLSLTQCQPLLLLSPPSQTLPGGCGCARRSQRMALALSAQMNLRTRRSRRIGSRQGCRQVGACASAHGALL